MTSVSLKRRHSAAFDSSSLFWLPLELLEEISYYFTRAEADQVLTVNSTLHEVFANRIWRHITSTDQTVWKAPASAWNRYGHLVRSLVISDELFINVCIPNLPKLLQLEVSFGGHSHNIFEYEMPLLQQLNLKCPPGSTEYQKAGVMAAAKWVARAETRSQDMRIYWALRTDHSDKLSWLDDVLDTITRPEQHFVTLLTSDELAVLPEKNATKLAVMLVNFSYNAFFHIYEDTVLSTYTDFLTNCDHVFSKLRHLSIGLTHDDGIDSDKAPKLKDSQFPVLDSIDFRDVESSDNASLNLTLDGTFKSVSSIQLSGCNDSIWDIITSGSFAGIEMLFISWSELTLNPLILAQQFPHLKYLTIDADEYCEVDFSLDGFIQSTNVAQLQCLKYFTIGFSNNSKGIIPKYTLQFLFYHAPNLKFIDTNNCWFARSELNEFVKSSAVHMSMQHLSVSFCDDWISEDDFGALIGLLPKLETLKLNQGPCVDEDLVHHLRNQHPHIKIEATAIEGIDEEEDDYDDYDDDDDDDDI